MLLMTDSKGFTRFNRGKGRDGFIFDSDVEAVLLDYSHGLK